MNAPDKEKFKVFVETTMLCEKSEGIAKAKTITNLLQGKNVNIKHFYTETGDLTKEGYQTLTELLVQGLNVNIQGAHQAGMIDSAQHLRHVISRLEILFVNVANVRNVPINSVDIDD